jgi:hypothetical protein
VPYSHCSNTLASDRADRIAIGLTQAPSQVKVRVVVRDASSRVLKISNSTAERRELPGFVCKDWYSPDGLRRSAIFCGSL